MARKVLYMGPRLKAVRRDLGLTQANMASDLEISPSYIALMERNQRPVTADMLIKLATTYRIDIADLAVGDTEEISARLRDMLSDPIFADIDLPPLDVEDIAASYPGFAEALMRLHSAFRDEQLALAEQRDTGVTPEGQQAHDAVGAARTFLAQSHNYFDDLEKSASALAHELRTIPALEKRLFEDHGLEVRYEDDKLLAGSLRWHDYHRRRVIIAEKLDASGRKFQLALQLALLEAGDIIARLVSGSDLRDEESQQLIARALQSYWAAAVMMPYDSFAKDAANLRYDIEHLARRYGVSFEQASHRLTTLQRPGAEGVPFFFVRVDQAGNVSKRLDGGDFPFARYGGGCPLWNVHQVFVTPGQVDAQRIELPDGQQFISIARTVSAGGGTFGAPSAMRAIALACDASHAKSLIYADDLLEEDTTPIGVSCRICHRPNCLSRSAPTLGREMISNRFRDTGVPFAF